MAGFVIFKGKALALLLNIVILHKENIFANIFENVFFVDCDENANKIQTDIVKCS